MSNLSSKKCISCSPHTPTLKIDQITKLLTEVPNWLLIGNTVVREFKFKNFKASIDFVNKVAKIAEREGHHPDINIVYNRVKLTLFTHISHGLTENDFILAAKIDQLEESGK